jgi:hypothetical protein
MTVSIDDLRRIAEVEFADIIVDSQPLGEKVRFFLFDASYVDVGLSRKLYRRFGFHWERMHIDGRSFRYDNFPNTAWREVETYPRHFHDGSQNHVVAAPFSEDLVTGLRQFLGFARETLSSERPWCRLCESQGLHRQISLYSNPTFALNSSINASIAST